MNKTTLNSQKEKHSMLSLRRATPRHRRCTAFRTYFYPRPPCGERPAHCGRPLWRQRFLSTLSLRRATGKRRAKWFVAKISIHALLAESDQCRTRCAARSSVFLSTLSLRRATAIGRRGRAARGNFYPRSPCGERHGDDLYTLPLTHFYPRSPCGERR